jgi:2-deoxy-D-gluconate 3-dehydrogenase
MITHTYCNTPFDLSGLTAIVTGGTGLLGTEFCKALASAGANVAITDINQQKLGKTLTTIQQDFPDANLIKLVVDVTNTQSIKKCIQEVCQEYEKIDILVNSAAIDAKFDKDSKTSNYLKFTEFPENMWAQSISVNLTGTFLMTQAVCRIMEKYQSGSIIHLGSNYGLVGPDQRIYKKNGHSSQSFKPPVYSVCKAGLIGLTKFMATYYAGTKIRVNMLTPSGVYNNQDKEFVEKYSKNNVLRRMSKKEEYWGALLFLASDASSYMTGGNLIIDGGWTAL